MVYERAYPHPIERVWDAVTTAEQLDAWIVPACLVAGTWTREDNVRWLEVSVADGPGPVHVRLVHEYESHLRSARPAAEA